METQWH